MDTGGGGDGNAAVSSTKVEGFVDFAGVGPGGLFGAFFLMLLVLLAQKVWINVKSGGAK